MLSPVVLSFSSVAAAFSVTTQRRPLLLLCAWDLYGSLSSLPLLFTFCCLSVVGLFVTAVFCRRVNKNNSKNNRDKSATADMGKLFREYLSDPRIYTCSECHAHLTTHDSLVSKVCRSVWPRWPFLQTKAHPCPQHFASSSLLLAHLCFAARFDLTVLLLLCLVSWLSLLFAFACFAFACCISSARLLLTVADRPLLTPLAAR